MANSLLNILSLALVVTVAAGSGLLVFRAMRLSAAWSGETLVVSAGFGFIAIIYGFANIGIAPLPAAPSPKDKSAAA